VGFNNVPQAAKAIHFSLKKAFSLIIFALIAATLLYSLTLTLAQPQSYSAFHEIYDIINLNMTYVFCSNQFIFIIEYVDNTLIKIKEERRLKQ